ncbi:uncharacterized protein METZ01_LOCUS244896, partial [marine metagenome]
GIGTAPAFKCSAGSMWRLARYPPGICWRRSPFFAVGHQYPQGPGNAQAKGCRRLVSRISA